MDQKTSVSDLVNGAREATSAYLLCGKAEVDARYLAADRMADAIGRLVNSLPLVDWVSDDTESCVMCAWPETSVVVLRIGHSITVCQEHIWRGLLAKLGAHPRGDVGYPVDQHA